MRKGLLYLVIVIGFVSGCSVLQTMTNVSRLKFKLNSVNNFQVNGIDIESKSRLSDFTATDLLRLTTVFTSGKLPVSFQVNVEAKNPNDGTGGYPANDITLKAFDWELYINDTKTISGGLSETLVVPGVGENRNIPLHVELDLLEFFGNRGMEEVLNLALKLGGRGGNTSNVKLIAQPVLGTPIGDLHYPEPVTIVDHQFN